MRNFIRTLLCISILCCPYLISGQKISGNVNSSLSKTNLGFANVNIYKNGKLVANVLTDELGNFEVKLDTGLYQCEINYAGFETIKKEIRVNDDEKADFSLSADKKSKYSAKEVEKYLNAPTSSGMVSSDEEIVVRGYTSTTGGVTRGGLVSGKETARNIWSNKNSVILDSANYGKLTAGEINDFSKWELWTDLQKGELQRYQQEWQIALNNRYTVQLKDKKGLPLVNAKVELLNGEEKIYTTKSDNTGKAELWAGLEIDTIKNLSNLKIKVSYNNRTEIIKKPTQFQEGINNLVLKMKCNQSQNVDIAIVVDATSSMSDEIEYLKQDLNRVIFQAKGFSKTLNLRFGNVFYRDEGDEYLTEYQDFTGVLSESVAYTNRHFSGGGGDTPEAVEAALDVAINQLNWQEDTRAKILFLVLDAPPHNTPEIQAKMKNLTYKAAEKGIRIVPLVASGSNKSNEYLMRSLALATNGTYVFLTGHSGIGGEHIEPSTDDYTVEILTDILVRVIKSFTYMPDCEQNIADLGVDLPDSTVTVKTIIDSTNIDPTDLSTIEPKVEETQLEWKFYPNPTKGIINIVANKEIEELYISDLSGKVIKRIQNIEANTPTQSDLSNFPSGIYLIRYAIGKQWISGKIILRH